ncbi:MAG: DegT/DnrJ/EryC1/StrS family aminotransferase [Bacteroidales bacterium]|jgi:UDP-2-acetamido-2-deoxy-ribo-hexuluronate aminotransferase|nr:DegT/DnrJ/EryC1/StrS family aminotransferase [Bacteroidales bacterium]
MDKINMVDLKTQYEKIKSEVDKGIQEVISQTAFINGAQVKRFQSDLAKYMDVKHAVTCGNGTDALQIAMMALDLKPGDEVITSDFTFIATVEVIALLGLKPVLVDVDPETFTLDIDHVKAAITPKTKAIVPVHLFGQSAPMEALMAVAKEHNLYIIEDTAQAIGSDYKFSDGRTAKVGTIGDIGCTSFFPSKNLGCYGDGGALFTNDDVLGEKIRSIVNHGSKKKYYHDMIGVNSRLDTIQAAVLLAKLPHLDAYNAARQAAADYYDAAFADCDKLITPKRADFSTHTFHQYTLVTKGINRDALKQHLLENDVPCAVYYPVPLHLQKAFAPYESNDADFPVTNRLIQEVISLPMHTELQEEQLAFITQTILKFVNQ